MGWQPPLAGAAAERALAAARDIAAELASWSEEMPADLSSGAAGVAIALAYCDRAFPGEGLDEAAERILEGALASLADGEMGPALHGGFCGIAWTVDHLAGGEEDPEPDAVETVLIERLESGPWQGDLDLIAGLAGFAIWGLELAPRSHRRRVLAAIVDRLEELGEPDAEGRIEWRTPQHRIPPGYRDDYPDGYGNLGLSHGAPGIVAALAAIASAGVESERAARLARGGVSWILHQAIEGADARYAAWVTPGTRPTEPARSAWCYGDPGVAAALATAGRCLGEPAWIDEARALGFGIARRTPVRTGAEDPGLCHGVSGLAHVLARLGNDTGSDELMDAAGGWFERLLLARAPGTGIAGFDTWDRRRASRLDPGFLTGAAGVAVALLAAASPEEPEWDRCLGLGLDGGPR